MKTKSFFRDIWTPNKMIIFCVLCSKGKIKLRNKNVYVLGCESGALGQGDENFLELLIICR